VFWTQRTTSSNRRDSSSSRTYVFPHGPRKPVQW
jgi:hypothetical protein